MTKTLKHRILACIIDYGIIAGYATLLFLVANLFFSILEWKPGNNWTVDWFFDTNIPSSYIFVFNRKK